MDITKTADKLIAKTEQQLRTDEAVLGIKQRAWEITDPAGDVRFIRTEEAAEKFRSLEGYGVVEYAPAMTNQSQDKELSSDRIIAGALFDFMGMLTTQDEAVTFGASHDASVAVKMLERFAGKRGLNLDDADVAGWNSALATSPQLPVAVGVPEGLLQRVKSAHQRIADGHSPRRIPADITDVDLVLAEVESWIIGTWPPFWIDASATAHSAAVAEPVAQMSGDAITFEKWAIHKGILTIGKDGLATALDSLDKYRDCWKAAQAASHPSNAAAVPQVVQAPKLSECRHCGFMVALNQPPADAAPQPVAAPIVPSDEQIKWQLFCDWWSKEIYGKKPAPEHRETFVAGFDACHKLLTTASNAGEAAQGEDK